MSVSSSYKLFHLHPSLLSLKMNTPNAHSFQTFYNHFIMHQQSLLPRLLVHCDQASPHLNGTQQQSNLIEQVLSNYNNYYEAKSNAARNNVFLFLSPPWFSSFERSLLWLSEFKPSLIFRILAGAITDLTSEQTARIDEVKAETRAEERALTEVMARIQESVASPPILNFARRFGRPVVDGELSDAEAAMGVIEVAMVEVVESADGLRGRTILKVREVLSSVQMVRFLAAAIEFQLRVRSYGMQRDSLRNDNNNNEDG